MQLRCGSKAFRNQISISLQPAVRSQAVSRHTQMRSEQTYQRADTPCFYGLKAGHDRKIDPVTLKASDFIASDEAWTPCARARNCKLRPLIVVAILFAAFSMGWLAGTDTFSFPGLRGQVPSAQLEIAEVAARIIEVESNGDANLKNKHSTAMGLGQFLDETWLEMIRANRPDLSSGRSRDEILQLRNHPTIAREIIARFAERNAKILKRRGMPVTPGTLYLAHFAGPAGAVAILSALENADAALVMASADATGRSTRERLIKANPFLARFTVADLRSWADRKMRVPDL